jgi:hypothetical protein
VPTESDTTADRVGGRVIVVTVPCEPLFTVASIRQCRAMFVDKCLRGGYVGVELGAVARAHLGGITRSVSEPESERAGKKVSPPYIRLRHHQDAHQSPQVSGRRTGLESLTQQLGGLQVPFRAFGLQRIVLESACQVTRRRRRQGIPEGQHPVCQRVHVEQIWALLWVRPEIGDRAQVIGNWRSMPSLIDYRSSRGANSQGKT